MPNKLTSVAMLSVHTCPFAALGGKKTGGMNVYIRELSRQLGVRGVNVDIFTRCESKDSDDIKRLGKNVKVIHIASGPEKTLTPLEIYPYLQEFTQNVLRFSEKMGTHYQLIHAHYWLSGLVALELRKRWKVPILQSFHTLGKVKNRFIPGNREPRVRLLAEEKLVARVDHLTASTGEERKNLIELYGARPDLISVIPPGVDTRRFHPIPKSQAKKAIGIARNSNLLLFVGRLVPPKGLETLLRAIAVLKASSGKAFGLEKRFELAIIGGEHEDRYMRTVKALSTKLALDDVASFFGSRDQRVLPNYYCAADMTIIPSSHESFGLVALESMACGTPVIAARVGGLQYLLSHRKTGLLVKPEDPRSLAVAIKTLIQNPVLRKKLGLHARREARKYEWKKIEAKVRALYTSLITHHSSAIIH